jgi:dsRNA-specific ribonuclease
MSSLRRFIVSKLKPVISSKYVNILTDEKSMEIYEQSFVSSTANDALNYEVYEQMGDVSANKFLVYYFYDRFPSLMCPLGVKVVARLKINYGSKKTFSRLAEKEGFWPYIKASEEWKDKRRVDLLEDVFEAFIGATEYIVNSRIERGLGAVIVEKYLKRVFDAEPISLRYTDLYDSKTRLKELMDKHGLQLGKIKYAETKEFAADGSAKTTSRVFLTGNGRHTTIGLGTGRIKSEAQRAAAEEAISTLNRRGYTKEEPPEYALFALPNGSKVPSTP